MKYVVVCLFFAYAVWTEPLSEELAPRITQFAADVYKKILKGENGNVVFSPISVETVLALLTVGATGPTQEELIRGLSLPPNIEKINAAFKTLINSLKFNTKEIKLLSANKIYVKEEATLKPDFKEVAVGSYESDVENIDFSKNIEAVAEINKWVEEQTNNKIKDLFAPDSLNKDADLVLVSAIYMSARFAHKFDVLHTKLEKFWKSATDSIELPTMSQTENYKYYDNSVLGAKFLEIPYEAGELHLVIILPYEKEGLIALEQNPEKLFEPQNMKIQHVEVKLPKFAVESEIRFTDILKALGISRIFNSAQADFSGIVDNNLNLKVSNVVQRAFINVTETGTEAAGGSYVELTAKSIQDTSPPKPFYVEHPFSYYIRKGSVILFAGRVNFK